MTQRKSTKTATAPKPSQRVEDAKEEEVVIKPFEDLMIDNAAKLRECSDRYNALVVSSDAKDRDLVAFLALLHDQIDKAIGAHSAVATAINDDRQVSPAEVEEAVAATAAVEQLEDKWKKSLINKIPTLAPVLTSEPTSDVDVIENKMIAAPTRSHFFAAHTWTALSWVLAALGFLAGIIITSIVWVSFFPGAIGAMAWVRYATLLTIPFMGFFIGGTIGSYVESRQEDERELIVVK